MEHPPEPRPHICYNKKKYKELNRGTKAAEENSKKARSFMGTRYD